MTRSVFLSISSFASRPGLRFITVFVVIALMLGWAQVGWAADEHAANVQSEQIVPADPHAVEAAPEHGEGAHHGLPAEAPRIHIGPFAVTNSMILTWVVAILVIGFAQVATRNLKEVPEGAQNFWEWLVEGLHDFLESIIGYELVKKTFWFFATVFIFILATNWFGLMPGVGTIGWGQPAEAGGMFHITTPLLRGVNADLNMTFAMAVIFFVAWCVWAFQSNGAFGVIKHLFGSPAKDMTGGMALMMAVIFAMVGLLEVVSILFRPVSLSFRLYGNIFAGENMLEAMSTKVPALSWLLPVPFYFMELLVGVVQALVFMLLTAVFTLLICSHGDDHGPGHDHAEGAGGGH